MHVAGMLCKQGGVHAPGAHLCAAVDGDARGSQANGAGGGVDEHAVAGADAPAGDQGNEAAGHMTQRLSLPVGAARPHPPTGFEGCRSMSGGTE